MVRQWSENSREQAQQMPIHQALPGSQVTHPKVPYSSHNGQNNSQNPAGGIEQKKHRGPQSQAYQDFAALVPMVGVSRFELEASWSRNRARNYSWYE